MTPVEATAWQIASSTLLQSSATFWRAKMQGSYKRVGAALAMLAAVLMSVIGCSGDPQQGKLKYLESGRRYMQRGKYQEAAIQFRNSLKLDPRFVEAFYQL